MNDVTEENGLYKVRDYTDAGYVDRMTYHYSQEWITLWDKDLNFVSLIYKNSKEDLTEVIRSKDKTHDDYHKAIRAKARHLRMLKEHLGMEVKPTTKEKTTKKIIYREKSSYESLGKLRVMEGTIHPLTISGGFNNFKKHSVYWTELTPQKQEMMEEYNQALQSFKEYQKVMFEMIFEQGNFKNGEQVIEMDNSRILK